MTGSCDPKYNPLHTPVHLPTTRREVGADKHHECDTQPTERHESVMNLLVLREDQLISILSNLFTDMERANPSGYYLVASSSLGVPILKRRFLELNSTHCLG